LPGAAPVKKTYLEILIADQDLFDAEIELARTRGAQLNMQLRVTRPGFIEGIRAFKASQGIQNYDVNKQAIRQEMRAYVCGQCRVEYYFKGPEKRLVYPRTKGLKVEEIQAYYDEVQFKDWTHADTGAPALKAQHPEFELWNQGIHARSGSPAPTATCRANARGTLKISEHHVRSPALNINRGCQTCHKWVRGGT
jgi:nitrite reductase (cytochrome c-552)